MEKINLNLTWNSDEQIDSIIGENIKTLDIPVQIKVQQNCN